MRLSILKTVGAGLLCAVSVRIAIAAPMTPPDGIRLEMTLSKSECLVGEPLLLTVTWSSEIPWSAFMDVDLRLPVLRSGEFRVLDADASRPIDIEKAMGLPVYDTRVLAIPGVSGAGETKLNTLTFSKVLIPLRDGELKIPKAVLRCSILEDIARRNSYTSRYPSYFDNNFFRRDVPDGFCEFETACSGRKIAVQPLPSGVSLTEIVAVCGNLEVSVTATPRSVRIGEPIELCVRLKSDEYPEGVSRPDIAEQLRSGGFSCDETVMTPQYEGGAVVFKYIIRPENADITRIPPIVLRYIDSNSAALVEINSASVPVSVSRRRVIELSDAEGPGVKNPGVAFSPHALLAVLAIAVGFGGAALYLLRKKKQ